MNSSELICGPIIITKYLGATNYKNSRVKAWHKRDNDRTWSVIISWDYALSSTENHIAAAQALIAKGLWCGELEIVGRGHDQDNYYFLARVK